MVERGKVTKDKLEKIYSVINGIIKKPECYYTKEELEKLKKKKENVFL